MGKYIANEMKMCETEFVGEYYFHKERNYSHYL